jgi:hypothetical protein
MFGLVRYGKVTPTKSPSFFKTTFSASLTNLTFLLPQPHNCNYYVSKRILLPPLLWLRKHPGLRAQDSPDVWHQVKLAKVTCPWSWRCKINPTLRFIRLHGHLCYDCLCEFVGQQPTCFFLGGGGWRAPQQMLRTHRSLQASCVTLWWRWLVFSFFLVMEHRWNEIDRGKPKYSGKNLSQCHFVHYKSHMNWPWIEPGPTRWEAGH